MLRRSIVFLIYMLVISSLSICNQAFAQSEPTIIMQGAIKAETGAVTGSRQMIFRFFDQATGGDTLWEERAEINVRGGLYTHYLGSTESLNVEHFKNRLYVGINISGQEVTPRSPLTHSPYSLFAQVARRTGKAKNGFQAGYVMAFAGAADNVPPGYFLCDGRELAKSQYPELYTALGDTYGATATTFFIPDLRGEFLRGLDNERGVDPNRIIGSWQDDASARPGTAFNATGNTNTTGAHTHGMSSGTKDNWFAYSGSPDWPRAWGGEGSDRYHGQTASSGDHNHSINLTVNGGGDAETRPRNISVNYIIKY